MRVFENEAEVIRALENIPGAGEFRAVDFSSIPFEEQIQIIHDHTRLVATYTSSFYYFFSPFSF